MQVFQFPRQPFVPRIRIINLVDILFILLIFFIATTTFRVAIPSAVKVSLPEATTAEAVGKEKLNQVVISVGADESIYLDSKPVAMRALEQSLRAAKSQHPDLVLQFSADKSVSYGTIVAIVDAARAAGINNLTAFTKKSVK
jgi:biopolymer transport protein ExbD